MIQQRFPKKVKGARKKRRIDELERISSMFPTWLDDKPPEIQNKLISAWLASKIDDYNEFPSFVMKWETENNYR